MNKSNLLHVWQSFDNKIKYTQYTFDEGPLYDELMEYKILLSLDTKKLVDTSLVLLKQMLEQLLDNGVPFDELSVCPMFGVFVDNEYVDDNEGKIISTDGILNDVVIVSFDKCHISFGGQDEIIPIDTLVGSDSVIYASFSDFVVGLNECGFELEGISSFNDIKEAIINDEKAVGSIKLSLAKDKVYGKSN